YSQNRETISTFYAPINPIADIAFTPDGRSVIVLAKSGTSLIFDAQTGERISDGFIPDDGYGFNSVFSPDGTAIAVMWFVSASRPVDYRLPHVQTSEPNRTIRLSGENGVYGGPAFALSTDGAFIAWINEDQHTVHLRDVATGVGIASPFAAQVYSDIISAGTRSVSYMHRDGVV